MSKPRNWMDDKAVSHDLFERHVWPAVARKCGGGTLAALEMMDGNPIACQLDQHAGIDYLQQINGQGVRGISSRVQWETAPYSATDWGTFTIRYSRDSGTATEYEKRKEALRTGRFLYPYLTVQAYCDRADDRLVAAYAAQTFAIFDLIDEHADAMHEAGPREPVYMRRTGNARFVVVNARHVADHYRCVGLEAAA